MLVSAGLQEGFPLRDSAAAGE